MPQSLDVWGRVNADRPAPVLRGVQADHALCGALAIADRTVKGVLRGVLSGGGEAVTLSIGGFAVGLEWASLLIAGGLPGGGGREMGSFGKCPRCTAKMRRERAQAPELEQREEGSELILYCPKRGCGFEKWGNVKGTPGPHAQGGAEEV